MSTSLHTGVHVHNGIDGVLSVMEIVVQGEYLSRRQKSSQTPVCSDAGISLYVYTKSTLRARAEEPGGLGGL